MPSNYSTEHRLDALFDYLKRELESHEPPDPWIYLRQMVNGAAPQEWRASTSTAICQMLHPMKCVRMSSFLVMNKFLPYHEAKQKCLHEEPTEDSVVHLVSHQWLGDSEPDPDGKHLRALQAVFNRIIAGGVRHLFKDEDWEPFLKGISAGSDDKVKKLESTGSLSLSRSAADVSSDIAEGLIWLDYLSIPQMTTAQPAGWANGTSSQSMIESMNSTRSINSVPMRKNSSGTGSRASYMMDRSDVVALQQAHAINSIPAYVERCNYFWICAPHAKHSDSGLTCDFHSWRSRGWCRLEEWTNALAKRRKMPLLISDSEKLSTVGAIDFLLSQLGRSEKAVCSGDFTCCRLNHRVGARAIPCDKDQLGDILLRLYDSKLQQLKANNQRLMYGLLLCLRETVYSGTIHQPGRPSSSETVNEFLDRIAYKSIDDLNEIGDTPLHWAVFLADVALVSKLLTAKPELANIRNKVGLTALTLGAFRNDAQLPLVIDRVMACSSPEELNAGTKNGITVLDRAASSGFAENCQALIMRRAQVDVRRLDNGYSPLLSAAEAGYAGCCEVLLKHRADINATSKAGNTALQLATNPQTLLGNSHPRARQRVLATLLEHIKKQNPWTSDDSEQVWI